MIFGYKNYLSFKLFQIFYQLLTICEKEVLLCQLVIFMKKVLLHVDNNKHSTIIILSLLTFKKKDLYPKF